MPVEAGRLPTPAEGVTATVQAFCYNRDAAKASELHRRFWVGTIPELLQKVGV